MVKPVTITITPDLVGLNKIDLPQFSGYDVMVTKRGMDYLSDDEVMSLPTGGFQLKREGDTFILGEKYTVIPLPVAIAAPFSNPVFPVSQYPHRMVVTTVTSSTQDANGNWQAGTTSTVEKYCRAEPNNKNAFVLAADGTQVYYAYTVYMPLPADLVAVGTKVSVYDGTDLLSDSTVKRFSRGQLNVRLWL